MKPSVVVPWLGFTISTTSLSKASICSTHAIRLEYVLMRGSRLKGASNVVYSRPSLLEGQTVLLLHLLPRYFPAALPLPASCYTGLPAQTYPAACCPVLYLILCTRAMQDLQRKLGWIDEGDSLNSRDQRQYIDRCRWDSAVEAYSLLASRALVVPPGCREHMYRVYQPRRRITVEAVAYMHISWVCGTAVLTCHVQCCTCTAQSCSCRVGCRSCTIVTPCSQSCLLPHGFCRMKICIVGQLTNTIN